MLNIVCSTFKEYFSKSTVHQVARLQNRLGSTSNHPSVLCTGMESYWLALTPIRWTDYLFWWPHLLTETQSFLGVLKLLLGLVEQQMQFVSSWNHGNVTIGMCFDTIASNSGGTNVACTFLENRVTRFLLCHFGTVSVHLFRSIPLEHLSRTPRHFPQDNFHGHIPLLLLITGVCVA